MDLEGLINSAGPSDENILDAVDEYTLYCYYSGIEDLKLNRVYPAPYRSDPLPSFVVFLATRVSGVQYLWKDHGKGEIGNIFTLIQRMCNLGSRREVYARISEDFGLGYNLPSVKREKIILYEAPSVNDIKIRVADIPLTEKGLAYWDQFAIDKKLLDLYNTVQIEWYWSYEGQQSPYLVPDPTFAYRTGQYYQIYSPFAPKQQKFRNDLPENYFFGYLQLPKTGDKLIIDKSCKDVIFCKRLGYDAVCGKSETTFIPDFKMIELHQRFKDIYLMLDNDAAGKKMTDKYLSLYPWLKPRFLSVAKDKTDACKLLGVEGVDKIVQNLLNE